VQLAAVRAEGNFFGRIKAFFFVSFRRRFILFSILFVLLYHVIKLLLPVIFFQGSPLWCFRIHKYFVYLLILRIKFLCAYSL
jgi:hypothetical protein